MLHFVLRYAGLLGLVKIRRVRSTSPKSKAIASYRVPAGQRSRDNRLSKSLISNNYRLEIRHNACAAASPSVVSHREKEKSNDAPIQGLAASRSETKRLLCPDDSHLSFAPV